MLGLLSDFTGWLSDVSSHWWFLAIVLAVAFLDSVVPVVPSETSVIIAGIAAAGGAYPLAAVILTGAVGAFLGDNAAYLVGRYFGPWIERRASASEKFANRLEWAKNQIRTRGGLLLITARFIPGGRTALTLASGITAQPRKWFAGWIAIAAVLWATYGALLGYIGGKAFEDNHTKAFVIAFAAAVTITIAIEVIRHLRAKRQSR